MSPIKKILFVCTGNTCRSVMAEWFFNKAAAQAQKDQLSADSAGISAYDGEAPSKGTVGVLRERYGITESDIRTRSKTISKDLVDGSDLILAMTRRQRDHVARFFPEAAGKVFTLNEYLQRPDIDIEDPYGFPDAGFKVCADTISEAVSSLQKGLGIGQKRI